MRLPGPGGDAELASQAGAKLNRDGTMGDDATPMGRDQMGRDGSRADAQKAAAQQEQAQREETRQEETRQGEAVALRAEQEKAAFEQAAEQITQAVRADPALADLARQLAVDITPQGLRIQIMDEVKLPMFPTGSATPNERARLLIQKVVPVLMKLRHPISIAGHTDAQPFPGPDRTNWELSAERANATRRLLTDGGFPEADIRSVSGHADHDPLLPADPMAAANRRIAIMVLREAPLPTADPPPAPSPPAAPPRGSAVQPARSTYGQPSDGPGRPGRQSAQEPAVPTQAPAQPNQEPMRGSGRPAPLLFGTTRPAPRSALATDAAAGASVTASRGATSLGAIPNLGEGAPADAATEAAGPVTRGR
jgi:flagellar motor protein MotB